MRASRSSSKYARQPPSPEIFRTRALSYTIRAKKCKSAQLPHSRSTIVLVTRIPPAIPTSERQSAPAALARALYLPHRHTCRCVARQLHGLVRVPGEASRRWAEMRYLYWGRCRAYLAHLLQVSPPHPYLPLVLPGSTTSGNGSSYRSADARPGQPPTAVALATAVQSTERWQRAEDFPCASALSASGAAVRVQTTQARLGHALEAQRGGAAQAVRARSPTRLAR
jgi:hypothetical protein